jgi:peptide/nickel transport system permease protein
MKIKILNYLAALLLMICINFTVPLLLPGDPVLAMYGNQSNLVITPQLKQQLQQQYKLDRPWLTRFCLYLKKLRQLDFGDSFYHQQPVLPLVLAHLPWSFLLISVSLTISAVAGTLLGFHSAWKRNLRTDRFLMVISVFLSSLPGFIIGTVLLILFAVKWPLFPLQGGMTAYASLSGVAAWADIGKHAVLPVLSLILTFLPGYYLLARNSMIGQINQPYVMTAQAKGLTQQRIKYFHVGRNSLIPVFTGTAVQLVSRAVTGSLLVEIVFSYPGIGGLLYQAVSHRDYPLIQMILLLVTVFVLAVHFIMDWLYPGLNPKGAYA